METYKDLSGFTTLDDYRHEEVDGAEGPDGITCYKYNHGINDANGQNDAKDDPGVVGVVGFPAPA